MNKLVFGVLMGFVSVTSHFGVVAVSVSFERRKNVAERRILIAQSDFLLSPLFSYSHSIYHNKILRTDVKNRKIYACIFPECVAFMLLEILAMVCSDMYSLPVQCTNHGWSGENGNLLSQVLVFFFFLGISLYFGWNWVIKFIRHTHPLGARWRETKKKRV